MDQDNEEYKRIRGRKEKNDEDRKFGHRDTEKMR